MTMKRILTTWLMLAVTAVAAMAQSQYISYEPYEAGDRDADLNGAGGVLILSERSDLAITVINAQTPTVVAKGQGSSGLYEYEVVVSVKETRNPKLEVNRRGDVNRVSITASTRPDRFRAYKIEEVAKPILLEDQTAPNDAILDSTLAEVVISSAISDLQVNCQALQAKGAELKTSTSSADNTIINKSLIIPIRIFREAQHNLEVATRAADEKRRVLEDPKAAKKLKDSFYDELDELERLENEAREEYQSLTSFTVSAAGTNVLSVFVGDLKPRSKKVYGVAVVKVVEEKHVSVCSGFLAEGARLYSIREYANAKQAFGNAMRAKDCPADLKRSIQTNINQCDTCALYERYAMAALAKLKEVRDNGGTQEEVVRYASAASEFMEKLNLVNPCEFYSERIGRLAKIVEDQPLSVKFTFVEWLSNATGFYEGDRLGGVEVWAYSGEQLPNPADYRNEKRFATLMTRNNCQRVGTSDESGVLDVNFDRKQLPTGLFFHPAGENLRVKTSYIDMREVMQNSQGDFQKRQYRTKMYRDHKK